MLGLRQDGNFARTAALEPGHVVVQIGPAPVEGAAVLAAEARAQLEGKVVATTLAEAEGALTEPGISVVDAAHSAPRRSGRLRHARPHRGRPLRRALRDGGDGGRPSSWSSADAVLWYEPGRILSEALGIDPWGLLASGALLAAFPCRQRIEGALATLAVRGFCLCAHRPRPLRGAALGSNQAAWCRAFARDEVIRAFSARGVSPSPVQAAQ